MENIAEVKKQFFRFLKEKRLYKRFIEEFGKNSQANIRIFWCEVSLSNFYGKPDKTFTDYIRQAKDKKNIVNFAFDWSETKEGHDFWDTVDQMWQDYINEY